MSIHQATIVWKRNSQVFSDNKYSREHRWDFDGGAQVNASASPQIVQAPMSNASAVDPEEAFVASLSSCHLLWFLSFARQEKFIVDSYRDEPKGFLTPMPDGRLWISKIILSPQVLYGSKNPTKIEEMKLHAAAHQQCFLANSVKCEISIEPIFCE